MTTRIKTIHEETYGDSKYDVGILINYSTNSDWFESFLYLFREQNYIFFHTIADMYNYLLFSRKDMKRAYMSEKDFDMYYDSANINGKFSDILQWFN